MAKFFKGAAVVQKMPAPIRGVVTHFDVDQQSGDVQVHVEYEDDEGKVQGRFFKGEDLELEPVEEPEPPADEQQGE